MEDWPHTETTCTCVPRNNSFFPEIETHQCIPQGVYMYVHAPDSGGLDAVSHSDQVVSMPHVLRFFGNEHHLPAVG